MPVLVNCAEGGRRVNLYSWKERSRWKSMAGRWNLLFGISLFSETMLVSGSVYPELQKLQNFAENLTFCSGFWIGSFSNPYRQRERRRKRCGSSDWGDCSTVVCFICKCLPLKQDKTDKRIGASIPKSELRFLFLVVLLIYKDFKVPAFERRAGWRIRSRCRRPQTR